METRAAKALSEDIDNAIGELESIFPSEHPLERLKEFLGKLSSEVFFGALADSFFLYNAFEENYITLEIIQYINKIFPGAASIGVNTLHEWWDGGTIKHLTYPIHMACMNDNCPDEVIEELISQSPFALRQLATIESGLINLGETYEDDIDSEPGSKGSNISGLPLHYYLQRESNISVAILEKLISAYPESMTVRQSANRNELLGEGVSPIYVVLANPNILKMIDVLQYLVETYPSQFQKTCGSYCNSAPIHVAIRNTASVNVSIVQLLLNVWPESIRLVSDWQICMDPQSWLPIHTLCSSTKEDLDDSNAMKILKLLMREHPASVEIQDAAGYLPLHHVVERGRSIEFCKVLIDSYPESVKIGTTVHSWGWAESLPIHLGVLGERVAGEQKCEIVQYLIDCYPESLRSEDAHGYTPLHRAAQIYDNTDTIELILAHDPSLASVQSTGEQVYGRDLLHLPLHSACGICPRKRSIDSYDSEFEEEVILSAIELLFDTYPEALFERTAPSAGFIGEVFPGKTPLETAYQSIRQHRSTYRRSSSGDESGDDENAITRFLEDQLDYARMAKDHEAMTTPDKKGRLALHLALLEGAPHGSIKLLLKGNPAALQVADNSGKLPLHLACEYGSVDTVKLFVDSSSDEVLDVQDGNMNYPLHLACLGKDYKVVQFLLKKGTSVVSKLNGDGKLPLHLLCEEVDNNYETDDEDSGEEENEDEDGINSNSDRESDKEDNTDNSGDSESEYSYSEDIECVETMMMLLLANPEIVSSFTPLLQETELISGSVSKRARMS